MCTITILGKTADLTVDDDDDRSPQAKKLFPDCCIEVDMKGKLSVK